MIVDAENMNKIAKERYVELAAERREAANSKLAKESREVAEYVNRELNATLIKLENDIAHAAKEGKFDLAFYWEGHEHHNLEHLQAAELRTQLQILFEQKGFKCRYVDRKPEPWDRDRTTVVNLVITW